MITVPLLIDKLTAYVENQVNELSRNNPMMSFIKPLTTRVTANAIGKMHKTLSLLADENGEIDIVAILSEMSESLMKTQPFTINTSFIGNIVIGNGTIKVGIPFTERSLIFNTSDIQNLKEILTN